MGWKGNLRKVSSLSNQISRESEKQQRICDKENAKKAKLDMQIDAAQEKPMKELKKILASGKVGIDQYNKLASRQTDLEREFFIKTDIRAPMTALSVRYLTGKIEKPEFELLRDEILGDLAEDRKEFLKAEEKLKKLVPNFNVLNKPNECIMCGKTGGFFSPLKSMTIGTEYKKVVLKICGQCANDLKTKMN